MDINDFILKLEGEFEDVKAGSLKPGTGFRDIENWSSMHALIIIALLDTEFNVTLRGEDLKTCITISDLFNLVLKKIPK